MRWLKECLKILAAAFLGLILIAVGIGIYIIKNPQKLFSEKNLNLGSIYLQNVLEKSGVNLTWSGIQLKVDSASFWRKRVSVSVDHVCYDDHKALRVCAKHFETKGEIDLRSLTLIELGPTEVLGGAFRLEAVKSSPQTASASSSEFQLPEVFAHTHFHPIRVDLAKIELVNGKEKFIGNAELFSKEIPEASLQFNLTSKLSDRAKKLSLNLSGVLDEKALKNSFDFAVEKISPQISKIAGEKCTLDIDRGSSDQDRLSFNCPIEVGVSGLPPDLVRLDLPKEFKLLVNAQSKGQFFPPDFSQPIDGRAAVDLNHFSAALIDGEGKVDVQYAGKIDEIKNSKTLTSNTHLSLRLEKFEDLVAKLKGGAWEIPAPFAVLHGKIELLADGKVQGANGVYPFKITSRLNSKTEAFNFDGDGGLEFRLKEEADRFHLRAKVLLGDVKLELPQLDLENPPKIFPDSRIQRSELAAQKVSAFHYDLDIETRSRIEILSNRAKAPIPIALKILLSDTAPLSGNVHVDQFPLELFKRDATLEHFDLEFKHPIKESTIDGEAQIKYTDYNFKVHLLSTIDKPIVKLESDPPLPDDQLYAVLIFGKPLDELDPEQASSSGNARSAMTDGAVGLASLYALASTPVESVGYDPETGIFTAKVRLAEGTSLNIGSDTSQVNQLGVRKRLGNNWMVETDLNHPSGSSSTNPLQGTQDNVSTFLQWSKRY